MKYSVGQILYVVLDQQAVVYPMQVIEEITKRTLAGSGEIAVEVDYLLLAGGKNAKHMHLSAVKGEIFESADSARISLVERATVSIGKHIEAALDKARIWYGAENLTSSLVETDFSMPEESDVAYIDLGDGMKGRVKINNSVS